MSKGANASVVEVLLFDVGGQTYGIAACDVQEVIRAASLVKLPKAPRVVEGVINIRGSVTAVLDVRTRFGFAARPLEISDQFVVARAGERTVALHVDRAIGLVQFDASEIEEAKALVPGAEYIAWMAKLADDIVLIHDLWTFLSRAESTELDAALGSSALESSMP